MNGMIGLVTCAAVAGAMSLPGGADAYGYVISPPVLKGDTPPAAAAPLRKDEARAKEEAERLYTEHIFVEGHGDPERRMPAARSVEQKFAEVLNAGNPEVPGGWIRHGTFYDGVFYWGNDPLSFVYYNVANRLKD